MPTLSKTDLIRHRVWLSEWRSPVEMGAYVATVNDTMGSSYFFRQGGIQFLRDAWLAAKFGQHRQSSFVRLIPERELWPDFEVQDGNATERVECVEADIPGRRRGEEYRESEGSAVTHDPVEDWITRADQAPAALSTAIAKKTQKSYAGRASLLVYLNIGEFGIRQTEIEAAMEPAVAPALPHFERVWILWKERLYGPWSI